MTGLAYILRLLSSYTSSWYTRRSVAAVTRKIIAYRTRYVVVKFRQQNGRRHRQERPLLLASAFDNGLADRKSAFRRLNGNILATSCPYLVNFRSIIWEFTLLKRAIFVAIRPHFDDDLHSSRWRFQMDWKVAILI